MTRSRIAPVFLAALIAIAVYFCYILAAPFLKPILFSAIMAIICYPVYELIHRWIRNGSIAAALSTIVITLLVISVGVFLGRTIVAGLRDVYQSLVGSSNGREQLSLYIIYLFDRALEWTSRYIPFSVPELQGAVLSEAEKAVAGMLAISAGILGGITSLAVDAVIAFFILFFFLRDGRSMIRRVAVTLPLRRNQVTMLFTCVKGALNAIVYGTLAIAALQGILTGSAFWFLGLSSPALWGVVTGLCALLPVIGTGFVLFPAIGMLIFSGHWIKGLILLIWAVAVVHPVDNVLRPYLIGGRVKVSTLYVFFALLGGLKAFGALGVFIGPLILAVTVALFRFLREEARAGKWDLQENAQEHVPLGPLQTLK